MRPVCCRLVVRQAMLALGEERSALSQTTQKLDTSLREKEVLLIQIEEAKTNVREL